MRSARRLPTFRTRCSCLRRGTPSVQVGHGMLHEGKLTVNPLNLNDDRAAVLARRLREELM